jgi:hypothetical protein
VAGRQFVYDYGLWSYLDNPVLPIMIYLSGVNPQPRIVLLIKHASLHYTHAFEYIPYYALFAGAVLRIVQFSVLICTTRMHHKMEEGNKQRFVLMFR